MKTTDLRKLDAAALKNKIASLRKELLDMRLSASTQMKNSSQFKKARRGIAQALTFLSEKKSEDNTST